MTAQKQQPLNDNGLPRHIAIIMDGNGRWANQRNLPRYEGHRHGVERVREIVRACGDLGVQFLTLYAFSKENWSRPKEEVTFLMKMLGIFLDSELKEIQKSNVKFRVIGRLQELPVEIQKKIKRNIDSSVNNTGLTLSLALSYSSRAEILDGVRKIAAEVKSGKINPEEINEKMISDALYTKNIPDPDLLIRTSGELRISNFLLWQISYTELYITDKFWPEFHKEDLVHAIDAYRQRDRRFGSAIDLVRVA